MRSHPIHQTDQDGNRTPCYRTWLARCCQEKRLHTTSLHLMMKLVRIVLNLRSPAIPHHMIALHENERAFARFFLVPRVLRPLSGTDPSTTILGFKSTLPIFACGAALAKLGHPDGAHVRP